MKSAYRVGKVSGTVVSIHWTFLPLIAWMIFVNFLIGVTIEGIVWSLIMFFSIFASLLAHEFGHTILAGYFNIRATSTILFPFGGVSDFPVHKKNFGKYILISLAGPLVNLAIAVFLLIFIHPYHEYWMEPGNIGAVDRGNFIFQLQVINLSLGLFNLIPAFPMDGGRIMKILFSGKMNIMKATRIEGIISICIGIALVALGFWKIQPIACLLGLYIIFTERSEKSLMREPVGAEPYTNNKFISAEQYNG